MPRKQMRTRRSRQRKPSALSNANGHVVRVPFDIVTSFSTTANQSWTVASVQLHPIGLGTNLAQINDCFNLWRCLELKVQVEPLLTTVTGSASTPATMLSFTNTELTVAPGGWAEMSQMPAFSMTNSFRRAEIVLKGSVLAPTRRWLYCNTQSTTVWADFNQGEIYVGCYLNSTTTPSVISPVRFSGLVEFKDFVAPALTVSLRALEDKSELKQDDDYKSFTEVDTVSVPVLPEATSPRNSLIGVKGRPPFSAKLCRPMTRS